MKVKSLKASKTDIYRYLKNKSWFQSLDYDTKYSIFHFARMMYGLDVNTYGEVKALRYFHIAFKNGPIINCQKIDGKTVFSAAIVWDVPR